MGCHGLLQGIFPSQGSNLPLLSLLIGRQIVYDCATWEARGAAKLKRKRERKKEERQNKIAELQGGSRDVSSVSLCVSVYYHTALVFKPGYVS